MIHSLSEKVRDLAIQELADLIKNDTIVLERVVNAANTVGYNPLGVEITTVGEAIQVIGFDRVRSLSMSLILLENSNAWQYSDERKKATLASLTSGLMAEQLAADSGRVDPEVAFLCGALRGFGRIVLATYMLDDLREAEALKQVESLPTDEAYKEVFGLTPIELSQHLMEASHMSPTLLKTLHDYHPERHKKELMAPEDRLLGIADYAYQLAQIAIEPAVGEAQFRKASEALRSRYAKVVEESPEQLDSVLQRTGRHLKALASSGAQSTFSRRAVDCISLRVDHVDPPKPAADKEQAKAQEAARKEAEGTQSRAALEEGIERMRVLAEGANGLHKKAIEELLKTVRQGLEAQECWAFLKVPGRTGFTFSQGLGTHSLLLEGRAVIQPREQSVFGLCLMRRETVFISNARDPKIKPHLPDWYLRNVQLNSFVLLCLQSKTEVVGLIFAGWKEAHQAEIRPEHAKLIHQLLGIVAGMH